MNTDPDLIIPRRLAIRILHEAQVAQPQSINGVVGARAGEPASFMPTTQSISNLQESLEQRGETLWARLWSYPSAPAVPSADQLPQQGLSLVISLNTKGVLEMRAWELRDGAPFERVIKVRD